jgi:alpha-galactosidase
MTSPAASPLAALMPHDYLDLTASPLGPALRRQGVVAACVDDAGLETLDWATVGANGRPGRRIVGRHPGGLMIGVDMEPDPAHQALVWRLDLAQDDAGSGARLRDVCPLTLALDGTVAPDPVILTWLGGAMQSFFPPDAVTPQRRVVYPRTPAYYGAGRFAFGTRGGRSSDQYMPYLLLAAGDGSGGLWCAIGWSGHWTAQAVKPKDSADLCLTVRLEPCDLRLPPGTRLQGPSVALGLYRGDEAAGCNALRRWLRSRMPALPGDGDLAHFNTWTAMDANVDEARLLDAADRVAGQGLRYFMLDAGWYPCPPDNFSGGVGNWRVDTEKFPHGLEIVAARVRANGMRMGLWIEPERAHHTSEIARQHPDWILTVPGRDHSLVNFALPAVRVHFQDVIGQLVRRLDLRWLKWDFNMDPLPHWQAAGDGGLAHLGHIDGVWQTFDWLRRAFPDLVIENCASGGNRLDWTIFSRSHVNFANDQYTQPDCIRRIMGRMAAFLPSDRLNMIYGPYQRRAYGDDDWQVLLGSAFGVSEPVDNWTDGFRRMLHRHLAVHGAASGAQAGDFYRLTPDTPDLRAWEAWQMHDPGSGSGVLAVWRSGAPEAGLAVHPHGLTPSRTYSVGNLYDPAAEPRMMSGQTLQHGLDVSLPPDGAALYVYRPYKEKGVR